MYKIAQILKSLNSLVNLSILLTVLFCFYWGFLASDRYVSIAHLQVSHTDLRASPVDVVGLLSGNTSNNRSDQLMLKEYLLSEEMLLKLEAKFNLRQHYSDEKVDIISRMWFRNNKLEWFHRYYLSMVNIDLDEFTGLLVVRVEGFNPIMAKNIADMLVHEGQIFLNKIEHELSQTQVNFLIEQVEIMGGKLIQARQSILDFQNKKNLISPQNASETTLAIISTLEAKVSELEIEKNALSAYLLPGHASLLQVEQQIKAVRSQIADQKNKLTSAKGKSLNQVVEEMQRLQAQALFAEEVYKSALMTLEKGRLETLRTIKIVSVVRPAVLPEYPLKPQRLYNSIVCVVIIWVLTGVIMLLVAVIKDHTE
jgi:capsular polysaccharide transport system permease protein